VRTALVSPAFNLAGVTNAVVKYKRWYSDDHGSNPTATASSSALRTTTARAGTRWTRRPSPTTWEQRVVPLQGIITPSRNVRFQFIAQDQPDAPSTTEAAIDDFQIIDPKGGCSICAPQTPGRQDLRRQVGQDTTLSWSSDPVSAPRYNVYRADGAGFAQTLRIGSTTTKSFVHASALNMPGSIFYLVSAVNACGQDP
jgi:hypothetical protein